MTTIGIRRETKSPWERRVAVTPPLAGQLTEAGHTVYVERSERRVFPDAAYAAQGCQVVDDLPACQLVFGVKEFPLERLQPGAAHLFFAHVIKAQAYNMPMLARLLELDATLIDYEKITGDDGKRLVFFGRFAGLAGMIDSLWALGQRLDHEGVASPFQQLRPAHAYAGLDEALAAVKTCGQALRRDGVPEPLRPLIVGVTGTGNVAGGVQEVLAQLDCEEIAPAEVAALVQGERPADPHRVYRVTFSEEHLVRPTQAGQAFQLQEYYDHPERYQSDFAQYHPHLSLLINCIYWTEAYPRLVRKQDLPSLVRCKVIGDISCDVEGSVEATVLATDPDTPAYTYDAASDSARPGVAGEGPVIMAVEILPAELPRDASEAFAGALGPFLLDLARADFGSPNPECMPAPLARACIVWRGALTPEFTYLEEAVRESGAGA